MPPLFSAGATSTRALERVSGLVSRVTTTEQCGDPTLPPTQEKKRAYWTWFACAAVLETYYAARRTQTSIDEHGASTGASEYVLLTRVLSVSTRLIIDLYTLRSLNALGERSGLRSPSRSRGAPALEVSEETSVLIRHFFKLLHGALVVNHAMLVGEPPDGFHAYPMKQITISILSPTFFGVAFAVKSTEGLLNLSFINLAFTAATALSIPQAQAFSNTRAFAYIEEPRGCENVPRVFLTVAVVLGLAPFVSSLVARLGKRVFAARFVPDPEARGREAASGKPAIMTIDRVADTAGPREDGSLELSASAFCFQGPEPLSVVICRGLLGVSPRVTFDGRVLRSSIEPIISRTGETRALLRVFPPDSWNGDTPVGRAWVVTGYQEKGSAGSSPGDREGTENRDDAGTDPFRPVGAAAPLLFLPDAETALEVNAMVALVRKKMDGVNADKLLLRLGNCITRATNNARDMVAMIDAVTAMGMKRCEAMLRDLAADQADFRTGDGSEAPSRAHHSRDVTRRRGLAKKPRSSSEDTDDVVQGPVSDARVFDGPVGTRTRSKRAPAPRRAARRAP